jgi:hypothetical protein
MEMGFICGLKILRSGFDIASSVFIGSRIAKYFGLWRHKLRRQKLSNSGDVNAGGWKRNIINILNDYEVVKSLIAMGATHGKKVTEQFASRPKPTFGNECQCGRMEMGFIFFFHISLS